MAEIKEVSHSHPPSRVFDIQRSLPDLKSYAQMYDKHLPPMDMISQEPELESNASSQQKNPLAESQRVFQRHNSESTGTTIPGSNTAVSAPLTYRDKEGLQWFVRGPAGPTSATFETPSSSVEDKDQVVDRYGFVLENPPKTPSSKSLQETKSALLRFFF